MERSQLERLLRELYSARQQGELDRLCELFAPTALFKIAGASDGKPISILAHGAAEIRGWLSIMLKSFRVVDYEPVFQAIDGTHAAVHWHAGIHSKVTGTTTPTEFIDLVQVVDGRIISYVEFFVPT
jgi:ketosteroid isomerase-like protein